MAMRKPEGESLHVLEVTQKLLHERVEGILRKRGAAQFDEIEAVLRDYQWALPEALNSASTSRVTGLKNRAALDSFFRQFNKKRVNGGGNVKPDAGVAFIHFDLGALKSLNDDPMLGHDYGDHVLARTGRLLQIAARKHGVPEDQVFHQGGDEFAIAVTGPEAHERARKIADFLVRFKNRIDSRPYARDPAKALLLPENSFKMGIAAAGNEPEQKLLDVYKKADYAGTLVSKTTNHGYLDYGQFQEKLSDEERKFVELVAKNVDSRSTDERVPVNDARELVDLVKRSELRLSRAALPKVLELIGKREYYEGIIAKLPSMKGVETPHR